MISIKQCVVVEGKYDKQKLSGFLDATVIPTDGFRIFKDKEKRQLLQLLAAKNGIIILTDSDNAGFLIRNHIKSFIPAQYITHVYIPEILGKEKRKAAPSKQGLLGVEGMTDRILLDAFKKAGVFSAQTEQPKKRITKLDLYESGLSGEKNSAARRRNLLNQLGFPDRISTNALVDLLNAVMDYTSYQTMTQQFLSEFTQHEEKEGGLSPMRERK